MSKREREIREALEAQRSTERDQGPEAPTVSVEQLLAYEPPAPKTLVQRLLSILKRK